MKTTAELAEPRRAYRQTARAAAAEATAQRIVRAFRERLESLWFDEIRLEDIAQDAGVTVQTVIRRFGGKEGLLDVTVDLMVAEIMAVRGEAAGDVAGAIRAVIEDYEVSGDLILRLLAQEARYPALRRITDIGRREHRAWVADTFAPWLGGHDSEATRQRLDALVVATDLYVWKLVRRDMGRPPAELHAHMERLIAAVLAE